MIAAAMVGTAYAIFRLFEAGGVQRQNKKVLTKPKEGWVKLNVDGSLLPHSAGCGGVLRDSSGIWVGGFALKLPQPSGHCSDEPEKEAIFRGLQWALGRKVSKVVVESDNKWIVDVVNSGSRTTDPLILQIRDLLSCDDWEATLIWIPGDANCVADKLADMACVLPSYELWELNSPPDSCNDALLADSQ